MTNYEIGLLLRYFRVNETKERQAQCDDGVRGGIMVVMGDGWFIGL